MKILYGTQDIKIDVTGICMTQLLDNDIITIPRGDVNRADYFTDPVIGILKKVYIDWEDGGPFTEYEDACLITINTLDNTVNVEYTGLNLIEKRLAEIHSTLRLNYGSFHEEYSEQRLSVKYLTGNEKVLEIGGNIGRNSLVIARILGENPNFVVLESDTYTSGQLLENRDLNSFPFIIENSAISKRNLIQKGWNTIESDVLLEGYNSVNIITYDELKAKHGIEFDTLIIDCEGSFYYILLDMPEILTNINLIIMENDYEDITHKQYIESVLQSNNFELDYSEPGGWGPCFDSFYEVWKKVV